MRANIYPIGAASFWKAHAIISAVEHKLALYAGQYGVGKVKVGQGVEPLIQGAESPPCQSDSAQTPTEISEKTEDRKRIAFPLLRLRLGMMLGRWLLWSFGLMLTAIVSATIGASLALMTPLSLPFVSGKSSDRALDDLWHQSFQYRLARPVNILVMGIDRLSDTKKTVPNIFSGNSDTMLLLRLDPIKKSVNMLSIPRDTQVEIPGIGIDKINDANVKGGAALAARVVSRTLNNVPIDRYVRVSTEAFRELVDLLGGVEVFVPEAMSYVDETQKLNINLAQGWQTLSGDRAEQFARFRNDDKGDIGRVQRQQSLLKALRKRLASSSVLPRLPNIIRVMQKYIDTNLSVEEMLALVNFGMKLEPDRLKMVMLPGRFSDPQEYKASYWIMDSEGRDRLMRDYFLVSSKRKATAENKPRSRKIVVASPTTTLKIAIQNASTSPDLGLRVARYLEAQGFDSVYTIQDWPEPLLQSQIIVQKGDFDGATNLQQVLGLGQIEAISTGDLESDITIRVGEDWVKSHPEPVPPQP